MKKILTSILFVIVCCRCLAAELKPTRTVLYAHRDTCDLYFDYYAPDKGAAIDEDGTRKPTVIFAFGGGFMMGSRNDKYFRSWFQLLTKEGYGVVSIDYRLGLKGQKYNFFKFVKAVDIAIQMGVEDLFSATDYLIKNGAELGVDADNLVVSGSSAGAIIALQAEYEICNMTALASMLPADFNYAGVMSFSGAIYSRQGSIKYKNPPCPQLLMHGTEDKIVPYRQIQIFNLCFAGTDHISKSLRKGGHVYHVYRFRGNMHEISAEMAHTFYAQQPFLQNAVGRHNTASMDIEIRDSQIVIPDWAKVTPKALY